MSSDPREAPQDPKVERLPFEPSRKKSAKSADSKPAAEKGNQKPAKKPSKESRQSSTQEKSFAATSTAQTSKIETSKINTPKAGKSRRSTPDQLAIPKVVSNRMARRMALFCGLPTALGMLTFIVSYFIVTKGLFKLPNVAVLLVSMGFLGLGVIGLSYGLLSASWDEERVGTRLGYEEFSINFGRLTGAWKEARQKKSQG